MKSFLGGILEIGGHFKLKEPGLLPTMNRATGDRAEPAVAGLATDLLRLLSSIVSGSPFIVAVSIGRTS